MAQSILHAYASWVRRSKNPLTANAYIRDVSRFLKWTSKPLDHITPLDVAAYFDALESEGLKPRSINRYSWALRSFFEAAGKPELARLTPTPVYEAPMPGWLEKEEVKKVVQAAPEGLAKTMLAVAYDLALRQGEVPLLDREWFYGENIKVRRLKRKGAAPAESVLPLTPWVADLLRDYLEARQDSDPALFIIKGGRGGRRWHRISVRTVNHIYRSAAQDAGVNPDVYSFHSFSRHSRATHLAIEMIQQNGQVDIARLAKFLGHASISSTLLYVHLATSYLASRKPT
jgi:site-specific recombinase XerD